MKTFIQWLTEANEFKVSMSDIHDGQGILNHDKVESHKKSLQAGHKLDPIILMRNKKKKGKKYFIYDGSHRYNAHLQHGSTHINAHIADNEEDAESIQLSKANYK